VFPLSGFDISPYLSALVAFAAAALIGLVADLVLHRFLNSRFARNGWAPGITLSNGLRGLPTAAGILAGLWMASRRLPLNVESTVIVVKSLNVLGILVATAFAARILGRLVAVYTQREASRLPSSTIFVNLARGTVWILGGISVLAALGVSIAPLVTALGVGGLAVGLALQPTLENVFSGVQVLASRQIEPGDFIRLETGEEGSVLDVTWRNTTIRRPSNEVVIVPNSVIGRSLITNFSRIDSEFVLTVPLSIAYGSDLEVVEGLALKTAEEVVAEVAGCVPGDEPSVRFADITPPTVIVNTTIRVMSYPERIEVRHQFIKRLQRRLAEAGVEAPPVAAPAAPTRPAR